MLEGTWLNRIEPEIPDKEPLHYKGLDESSTSILRHNVHLATEKGQPKLTVDLQSTEYIKSWNTLW